MDAASGVIMIGILTPIVIAVLMLGANRLMETLVEFFEKAWGIVTNGIQPRPYKPEAILPLMDYELDEKVEEIVKAREPNERLARERHLLAVWKTESDLLDQTYRELRWKAQREKINRDAEVRRLKKLADRQMAIAALESYDEDPDDLDGMVVPHDEEDEETYEYRNLQGELVARRSRRGKPPHIIRHKQGLSHHSDVTCYYCERL